MDIMHRASDGANVEVYSQLLSGAAFASIPNIADDALETQPLPPPPAAAPSRAALIGLLGAHLRLAILAKDNAHARLALGAMLHVVGETPDEMNASKASRVASFALDGNRVLYLIDRHPGRSWLQHRTQTRSVCLVTGVDVSVDDHPERLDVEDVRREFHARRERAATKDGSYQRTAVDAVAYALDVAPELGELSDEDIAIGWCARMARDFGRRAWTGNARHVFHALCSTYQQAVCLESVREDFTARAHNVARLAAEIWAEAERPYPRTLWTDESADVEAA